MYNGIGLRTVRGSGTAGYVNGNKAYVRPSQVRKIVGQNTGSNVSAYVQLKRCYWNIRHMNVYIYIYQPISIGSLFTS